MNNSAEQKKDKWLHYGFWFVAGILAAIAIFVLTSILSKKLEYTVPSGYLFVVEDHYAKNDTNWATYYVYNNYVLVTKDNEENKGKPAMIYDGVDSSNLKYDEADTIKMCDADSCYAYPTVLITIKKMIANKFGREYTGQ